VQHVCKQEESRTLKQTSACRVTMRGPGSPQHRARHYRVYAKQDACWERREVLMGRPASHHAFQGDWQRRRGPRLRRRAGVVGCHRRMNGRFLG
jgi:hypothetical protein